jgi:hypothetical protein
MILTYRWDPYNEAEEPEEQIINQATAAAKRVELSSTNCLRRILQATSTIHG